MVYACAAHSYVIRGAEACQPEGGVARAADAPVFANQKVILHARLEDAIACAFSRAPGSAVGLGGQQRLVAAAWIHWRLGCCKHFGPGL